jgi:hypothetical protein
MAPIIKVSDNDYTALKQLGIRHQLIETPKETRIVSASDFWKIPDIHYREEVLTADLSSKLLPVRTQQQHAEHRNLAQEGEFVTADMPFYIAMFKALFEQKDALEYAGQARDFIRDTMRQRFPITLTRIAYSPEDKDTVTHNYGTKDGYKVRANIVGHDGLIQRGDKTALNAVLGTGDVKGLNKLFNWLNGTDLSIYRFNEKLKVETEAVARLLTGLDFARVYCSGLPDYAIASLGVRIIARSAKK